MGINRILRSKDGFRTGAAAYVDPAVFAEKDLHHLFFQFTHPTYPQNGTVAGAFVSHLSTLDLLFNCGPDAGEILRKAVATSRLALDAQ
jgi:WbqC-like protein family